MEHNCHLAPQQEKLILLRDSEPCKPFPHGMDLLSGTAVDVVEHIFHFKFYIMIIVIQVPLQCSFVDDYYSRKKN